MTDSEEVLIYGGPSLYPNSDFDSLFDDVKLDLRTNATAFDTNDDGLRDGYEVLASASPFNNDSDQDTLSDHLEVNALKINPLKLDTDGDGLNDGYEVNTSKTDTLESDTDNDGSSDYSEIYLYHTDPLSYYSRPTSSSRGGSFRTITAY